MSKRKAVSSFLAALAAVVMLFPVTASAVQIGTETQATSEEPAQTSSEEPEDPDVTSSSTSTSEEPDDTTTSSSRRTTSRTTTTSSRVTTEDPDDTTSRTTTTSRRRTTTTSRTSRTTTSEEKESYYSANIDVSSAGFNEDNELNVKLKIDSDSKIANAKIFLDFDKDILEYVSSKINDEDIGGIATNSCNDGRYTFEYTNSGGTEFDGTFVTVTFKLKETKADQTSVMAVVDTLKDEERNDITNRTISNAIVTLPENKDDDSSGDPMPDGSEHTYQPINLSLSDKAEGVSLEKLGIKDYKSIETDNDSVAYVSDGKIQIVSAGECKMTVTYDDDSKGYFNLVIANDAPADTSSEGDSSSQAAVVASEDDNSSRNDTIKITAVIVIVCVALILLIVEYFVLIGHRRKKSNRRNSRRSRDYYEDDEEDDYSDSTYNTRQLNMPSQPINEPAVDESSVSYSYPSATSKVNDYADFLSGDEGEDIKFTGSANTQSQSVKKDIEDFTLSQGGVNR